MKQQAAWLWGLVVRPTSTIRDIVERGTLRAAVVVVLLFSVVLSLLTLMDAMLPATAGVEQAAGAYGTRIMEATRWLMLTLAVLMPILVLLNVLVGRALIHVLARAFRGSGQYWDLFKTQCYLYPLGVTAIAPLYLLRLAVNLFSTELGSKLNMVLTPRWQAALEPWTILTMELISTLYVSLLLAILVWLILLDVLMVRQVYGVSTTRAGGIAGLGYALIFALMCLCTCLVSVGLAVLAYTG